MSIRLVQKRNGLWVCDIRTKDTQRNRLRERPTAPDFVRTRKQAQTWAETRQRELARLGPKKQRSADMPTVRDFGDYWIENYARANQHHSSGIESKQRHLRLHINPHLGDLGLDEVGDLQVQKFKVAMDAKGLGKKSINNVLATLGRMLKSAVEWGKIKTAPAVKMLKKGRRPVMKFYSFADYATLLGAAKKIGRHHLAIIATLGETGMRRSEIIALEPGDVEPQTVHIQRAEALPGEVEDTKGNETRRVPISDLLAAALEDVPRNGERLFHRIETANTRTRAAKPGGPLSVEYLRRVVRLVESVAGLRVTGRIHILRHTFASHYMMSGGSLYTLQKLMGHKSIETTMIYAHLSPDHMQGEIDKLEQARRGRGTDGAQEISDHPEH